MVPKPVIDTYERPHGAIISIGSCDGAVRETRDRLEKEGLRLDYMRIRAFPFDVNVTDFLSKYSRIFVVEQNRDAQLRSLLLTEITEGSEKLVPILYYGGRPLSSLDIIERIRTQLREDKAA